MFLRKRGRPPLMQAASRFHAQDGLQHDDPLAQFHMSQYMQQDIMPMDDPLLATSHHILYHDEVFLTQRDRMQQEVVLSGKRKFKDLRGQLGSDLASSNTQLSFIQKLNVIISARNKHLVLPFVQNFTHSGTTASWTQTKKGESFKRIKKRIEKTVAKKEEEYVRRAEQIEMEALKTRVELQQTQMEKLQRQLDLMAKQLRTYLEVEAEVEAEEKRAQSTEEDAQKSDK